MNPTPSILCALAPLTLLLAAPGQDGRSTAGHATVKRFANLGLLPAPEMVVIEDLINYHRHRIPLPKAGADVALDLSFDAPRGLDEGTSVLQIGFATAQLHDARARRPLHLALVIDESGSMAAEDKMDRVRQGLLKFVETLRPQDRVAIVGYANRARVRRRCEPIGDRRSLLETIRSLECTGNTNLHAGLIAGYEQVRDAGGEEGRVDRRVILLTDGIANRGVTDAERIATDSLAFNEQGIELSTIGVGTNFNRDLLAGLARAGRGMFHFVADEADIEKVFVAEAQSLVGLVARDITLSVDHDPGLEVTHVFGYRPSDHEHGFTVALENFNLGMTSVLIAKVRARDDAPLSTRRRNITARLTYTNPDTGKRVTLRQDARFLDPRTTPRATDHEVRKSYTIAVMAEAVREMAVAAKKRHYGRAERVISQALEVFTSEYPNTRDQDLLHHRSVLSTYRSTLGQHIERFRRL